MGERETLGDFLERWLTDVVRPSVRPRTLVSYAQLVNLHVVPALGRVTLAKLKQRPSRRVPLERLLPFYIQTGAENDRQRLTAARTKS